MQPFHLNELVLYHDRSLFKIGTDSLILGAFASKIDAQKLFEPCCGCGLISLMIARKNLTAITIGIDLDKHSVAEAQKNTQINNLSQRVYFQQFDFRSYIGSKFDLIVMNPPYFDPHVVPEDRGRLQSRHNVYLSQSDIIRFSIPLLESLGHLLLILPYEENPEIVSVAAKYQLVLSEKINIYPYSGKAPIRNILHFVKNKSNQSTIEQDFFIQKSPLRNDWSDQYKSLLSGFKKF